jgi:Ser-tRNA(Ala) deacylase AlaX
MMKTIGEQRVRIDFNPSNEDTVFQMKQKAAELINDAERIKTYSEDPEVKRLASLAATAIEEGAMWLVKAATAGK